MKRIFAALGLVAAVGCGNDKIRRNIEPIEVVEGEPGVNGNLPGVSRGSPDGGVTYGGAAPYQVDSFSQPQVQQVDILWVIDSSPSMNLKQQRVTDNAVAFIRSLRDLGVDYHLGVISTDVFDPQRAGKLINSAGLTKPWIDKNTANADVAFGKNAGVGATGSTQERAFLAGMLALTPPISTSVSPTGNCVSSVDCFLRDDADLYVILMSDEEEKSCAPLYDLTAGYKNEEGCNEELQPQAGDYGRSEYWTRFYKGLKPPGRIVRVAAVAGTDNSFQTCADVFAGECDSFIAAAQCAGTPDCTQGDNGTKYKCCQALTACSSNIFNKAQWCGVRQSNIGSSTGPYYSIIGVILMGVDQLGWTGCVASHVDSTSGKKVIDYAGFYGSRYMKVAQNTGGVGVSICDADYGPGLAKLGLQATGLRSDFPLSRAPVDGTIVISVNGSPVAPGNNSWQYVRCSGSTPVNSIHFGCVPNDPICNKSAVPGPTQQIAVSYDVNVAGLKACP